MKYINLINKLPNQDKETIIEYINCFGVKKENMIPLNKWLESWSHANQKLYRLLGNDFVREFDYKFKKTENQLWEEITDKLIKSKFKESYHNFYYSVILLMYEKDTAELDEGEDKNKNIELMNADAKRFFNHLLDAKNFIEDEISFGIKYKMPGAKKMLQIQEGAKPLRAISRVIDYFKNIYTFEGYEEFRIQHSLIMNDKFINGKVCISIHPLDFMTMSDNASNWQSCMTWMHDGCYRVGTIEMMNSNNVVCAYLKNESTPFAFTDPNTGGTRGEWANKKWRQLFYINKDIIMGGKAYPFMQEDITRFVLDTLRDLAKENLNWTYSFGIEPYKDMLHISNGARLEKQRKWMYAKSKVKNNIIWDTKGMYNDMLNDNAYPYLCYRNKVSHTKIYSASGKCPCLQCGNPIIEFDEIEDYYNDRYHNTGAVLCRSCYDSYDDCDYCDKYSPTLKLYTLHSIKNFNHTVNLCPSCLKKRVKLCPCCGKPILINGNSRIDEQIFYAPMVYNKYKDTVDSSTTVEDLNYYLIEPAYIRSKEAADEIHKDEPDVMEIIYLCNDCKQKMIEEKKVFSFYAKTRWEGKRRINIINPKDWDESWRYWNLKNPDEYKYYNYA